MVASYSQIGKTVHYKVCITFGTTTSIGGSYPTVGLPVTAVTSSGGFAGQANYLYRDTGTQVYYGHATIVSAGTNTALSLMNASSSYPNEVGISATVPVTWGNTDIFYITGTYEAA